jgi:hypothetical protein
VPNPVYRDEDYAFVLVLKNPDGTPHGGKMLKATLLDETGAIVAGPVNGVHSPSGTHTFTFPAATTKNIAASVVRVRRRVYQEGGGWDQRDDGAAADPPVLVMYRPM